MGFRRGTIRWNAHYFRLHKVNIQRFMKLFVKIKVNIKFSILQTYYRSPMRRMNELEDHLIETWRKLLLERKQAKPDERPTLSKNIGMVSIDPDAR